MLRRVLILLLLLPLFEIMFAIQVFHMLRPDFASGQAVTMILASFLLSAFYGVSLIRRTGLRLLQETSSLLQTGNVPGQDLLKGILSILAGLAFIFPGFLSDILGLFLLMPFVRKALGMSLLGWVGKGVRDGGFQFYSSAYKSHREPAKAWQGAIDEKPIQVIDVSADS